MANNFLATANRVAAHLGKAPKDFTKEDIIRVVQDFDIRMVNLMYPGGEGTGGCESFLTHDHTCRKAAFCAQEKIVGSRPPNRVRNCVTDLEKTDR